jgi:hypothetical protein
VRRERWGPRTVDLDLVLWGDRIIEEEDLVIPHPALPERRFVLAPLAELAPHAREPRGNLTVGELLERCPDGGAVVKVGPCPLGRGASRSTGPYRLEGIGPGEGVGGERR